MFYAIPLIACGILSEVLCIWMPLMVWWFFPGGVLIGYLKAKQQHPGRGISSELGPPKALSLQTSSSCVNVAKI